LISSQIRALVVEDDPDDVLLLKDALSEVSMGRIKLDCVDRLSRALIQLGGANYDAILLDLNLPDSRGLDTLNTTIRSFPRLPVVVLSGLADDAITVEAVRRGAQDYLVKGEINGPLVMRVLHYAIERKQVEAVLRASETRYRTLVETSPNGITLADLEGKLILCNQQAVKLHGYSNQESMLGMDVFKLIAPHDRHLAALNTQKTLNEGRVVNAEYTLLRRDGSSFPGEISTALVKNNAGSPTGFINMTRDITERRKAIAAEKNLVKVEQEFIANIASELRMPLLSLMQYLELVHSRQVSDAVVQHEFLVQAARDARRLMDTVNELNDFSLLEGEGLSLNYEQIDFIQMLCNVLSACKDQSTHRHVALIAAPMKPVLMVDVDTLRMRRVLYKLVERAIRTSNKGGKVLVTCNPQGDRLVLNVIDEGAGMSQDECERIFDKYVQADATNNHTMGLGLYVSRQVVEAHGGTLTVSSQLGAGSTFMVSIPMNKEGTAQQGEEKDLTGDDLGKTAPTGTG
jgi:PAS domain S-box-containing protein